MKMICRFLQVYLFFTTMYVSGAPSYKRTVSSHKNSLEENHHNPLIEVRNATYHGYGPREEARAMCSVKTLEINATANATITRRLHGVVTSRELHNSIQRLELIIYGQMQQLWRSLDAFREQMSGKHVHYPDRRTASFRYQPGYG